MNAKTSVFLKLTLVFHLINLKYVFEANEVDRNYEFRRLLRFSLSKLLDLPTLFSL